MTKPIILASMSEIRQKMLQNAGVNFTVRPARVDEHAIRAALVQEQARARDIADTLAEYKARKIAEKSPQSIVIGSDQILECDGQLLEKPSSQTDAKEQLRNLSGKTHHLFSAVVVYDDGAPVWRQVRTVRMTMRTLSPGYIDAYVGRNWPGIGACVGCYQIEAEGVRLFSRIEGDYFSVLGMPLTDLLSFLTQKGILEG